MNIDLELATIDDILAELNARPNLPPTVIVTGKELKLTAGTTCIDALEVCLVLTSLVRDYLKDNAEI